jgi:hypothetical protein
VLLIVIYILTGIFMLIGVYLTIRYTPRCIINNTEMILQRKKILNESISKEEMEVLDNYEKNGFLYNVGSFILFVSVLIHILIVIDTLGESISFLHYISMVTLLLYIPKVNTGFRSNCFENINLPMSMTLTPNENTLNGLNIYFKNLNGELLDENESRAYKAYKYNLKEVFFVRHAINFGVILLLILDIFFGYFIILSLSSKG